MSSWCGFLLLIIKIPFLVAGSDDCGRELVSPYASHCPVSTELARCALKRHPFSDFISLNTNEVKLHITVQYMPLHSYCGRKFDPG